MRGDHRTLVSAASALLITVSVAVPVWATTAGPRASAPRLSFPLPGLTAYTATINSVFDHSMPQSYCADNKVEDFVGEIGSVNPSLVWTNTRCPPGQQDLSGYQNTAGTNFIVNGHFSGGGDPTRLYYDGHTGYDYEAADGTPVLAAAPGTVVLSTNPCPATNYGCEVVIQHGSSYRTLYAHLSSTYPLPAVGSTVTRGQQIAQSDCTPGPPTCNGPHLHFEVQYKTTPGWVPVDPYGWEGPGPDPYIRAVSIRLWGCCKPGDLDPTFGAGGIVTTDFGNPFERSESVAVQADGKILAAGYSQDGVCSGQECVGVLARYNGDGTLDSSFGAGGVVNPPEVNPVYAVAVQSDGRVLVAGAGYDGQTSGFGFARYESDGTLDPGFGNTGEVFVDFSDLGSVITFAANDVVLQPDGKIVAVGSACPETCLTQFAVARLNVDGSLDTSFGTGGKVLTDFAGTGWGDIAEGVAVQPDGRIVAAGCNLCGGAERIALARYLADGTLDTTFDGDGRLAIRFPGGFSSDATAVAVQPDGRIVAAGYTASPPGYAGFARFNADGSRDPSFDSDGFKVVPTQSGGWVSAVILQSDGKIVGGVGYGADPCAVVRLNLDGSLDLSFGTGGVVNSVGCANDIALQPDGKIVGASGDSDFVLSRYVSN
jgi:uncharacterized delta-60 repeat protein